jgi:hypothetical protein
MSCVSREEEITVANRVKGPVERLFVSSFRTSIRLANIPAAEQPKENYFRLTLDNDNYNALYSLALSAAVNGYVLDIRTMDEITSTEDAVVQYMVVDY